MSGVKLSGLYFVVDPTEASDKLLGTLERSLRGGVDLVQVWSSWKQRDQFINVVQRICVIARRYGKPLLINNDLIMAKKVDADGLHADNFDLTPDQVRAKLGSDKIVGYTTGNDLSRVKWAEGKGADYVSFCSIFPTSSVATCEIVPLDTVKKARRMVKLPIFASGGINLHNAARVIEAGADGIAVISALQKATDPEATARELKKAINSVLTKRTITERAF